MRHEEYRQQELPLVQALSRVDPAASSSQTHEEAVRLRTMKENDRSLRAELAEKKQNEKLALQFECGSAGNDEEDQDAGQDRDDEEASSTVSFRQTWPLPAASPGQTKKDDVPSGSGSFTQQAKSGTTPTRLGGPSLTMLCGTASGIGTKSGQEKSNRKESDSFKIPPLTKAPQFRSWKLAVRDEIAGASGDPDASFKWIFQVELPHVTIGELADSGEFASLDAKLAAGIARVAQGDLGRAISTAEEQSALKGFFRKGRQALRMIYDHYRISETEGSLLELQDLMKVSLKKDNLRSFLMDWEHVFTGMNPLPDVAVLETLFRMQIQNSSAMRDVLLY
jgi:hypothetical protein